MKIVQNSATDSSVGATAQRPSPASAGVLKPPADPVTTTNRRIPRREYLVVTHRHGRITERRMAAEQVKALDVTEVDFHWDTVFGRISIQPPRGPRIEYFGSIPGVGSRVGLRLLQVLMFSPGRLLAEAELRRLPGLANMAGNPLSARLSSIRRAFGDSAEDSWFLIAAKNPFRVSWNRSRSFSFIEAIAESAGFQTKTR